MTAGPEGFADLPYERPEGFRAPQSLARKAIPQCGTTINIFFNILCVVIDYQVCSQSPSACNVFRESRDLLVRR